jgi:hypothetical protein
MRQPHARSLLLVSTTFSAITCTTIAHAEDSETRLNALERQIHALQAELQHVKHDLSVHNQEVRAMQAQAAHQHAGMETRSVLQPTPTIPPGYALVQASPGSTPGSVVLARIQEAPEEKLPPGQFRVGNVTITLGGFIDTTAIWRSRNEVADVGSSFSTGIPLPNSPNNHQGEFRLSARTSRFAAGATAEPDANTKLTAYAEFDFQGAAPTANSVESNSYNPRLRQAYAVYDRSDLGLYFMGGQAWSLLTMQKQGITYATPNVNAPGTIDTQYVPGFVWARQPQFRVAKTLDGGLFTVAASIENPQTNYYTGPNGLAPADIGTVTVNSAGGSGFASTNNYSDEVAPDIIGKLAFDPKFAHFEVFGVGRFFHDRISNTDTGSGSTVTAGGGGAAVLVHLIPGLLDIQGSFLGGDGIGRYGSAQLPDAVVGPHGEPEAIPEIEALVGIVGHPIPDIDLYGFLGTEDESRRYFDADVKHKETAYGYGNPLYSNASCDIELGASSGCIGNTSSVTQGTVGAWWKFIHSDVGTMQVGAQWSYTHREIFQGLGPTPKVDENIAMFSFRYYPFQ